MLLATSSSASVQTQVQATASNKSSRAQVDVRVAGKEECERCSLSSLAKRLQVEPRKPIGKGRIAKLSTLDSQDSDVPLDPNGRTWFVKFADDARVRLSGETNSLTSRKGDIDTLDRLLKEFEIELEPAMAAQQGVMDELVKRAMRRTLRAQPDFAGMYLCRGTFADAKSFLEFGRKLESLDLVEFVTIDGEIEESPTIRSDSPNFVPVQNFLYEREHGVGADFAWDLGIYGQHVRLTDVESNFMSSHEDLRDMGIRVEPGTELPWGMHNHGTATLGVMTAAHNEFGVSGLAPAMETHFYPTKTSVGKSRRSQAVTNALSHSETGDIVVYEMQASRKMTDIGGNVTGYVFTPQEYDPLYWTLTDVATDAGVIVVAAAGNGSDDLDNDVYREYRERGDSGAIIVGAGSSNSAHSRLSFSNYGKRVDVQAWGENVVTSGYGDLSLEDGDLTRSYTAEYSGTSSATAIVGGVVALVQAYAKQELERPLTPTEMRHLLKTTGVAPSSDESIGPMVSVRGAITALGTEEYEAPVVDIALKKLSNDGLRFAGTEPRRLNRISVDAIDAGTVKEVYLEVNGQRVGDADNEEPYIFDVEVGQGVYDVRGVAVDIFGNQGRSRSIQIQVQAETVDDQSQGDSSAPEQQKESDNPAAANTDHANETHQPKASSPSMESTDVPVTGCTLSQANNNSFWFGLMLLPLLGWRRRSTNS